MNPTNPTRPTNKPLKPSKEVLVDQLKPVETSKPVEVTEISGEEEEYYDEYSSKELTKNLRLIYCKNSRIQCGPSLRFLGDNKSDNL